MFNKQEPQEPETNGTVYLHRIKEGRSSHTPIGNVDVFVSATPQVGDSMAVTFDVYTTEFNLNYSDDRSVTGYGEVTDVSWVVRSNQVLKMRIGVVVNYAYVDSTGTLLFDDENKKEV